MEFGFCGATANYQKIQQVCIDHDRIMVWLKFPLENGLVLSARRTMVGANKLK